MKKTTLSHRILALVLILVMTVQLLPLSAFATFGDLQSWDPGVDLSTLGQKDAINWPIKIYDYLSDGMLFEWMDTNTTTSSSSPTLTYGHTDGTAYITPYGNGYKPPATELGSDFTYSASVNFSSSNYNSPYYYSSSGCSVSLTKKDAVDYKSPYYLRISDNTSYSGSGGNHNMLLNYFSSDESTSGDIRYMVMVYRANKVEDYYCSISLSDDTGGTNLWDRNQVTIPDSSDWTYVVFDTSTFIKSSVVQWVWLTFHTTSSFNTSYKGMNSGAYLDLTHVGYFSDLTEANNYGAEAVKFDNDPGEYLAHTASSTYTHSYVTPVTRGNYLNYIFSLNYRWKQATGNPRMFCTDTTSAAYADTARYGMDFTTHSTDNGWKTNAYTSDTFWTWSNGTSEYFKYTSDVTGVTSTKLFNFDKIGVDQMTQSNGAQYVRLTTTGPSKIILSQLREDEQAKFDTYAPGIGHVRYMVLVYRANGLTTSTPYGFFAQGYDNDTLHTVTTSNDTADRWKYAGLTTTKDWTLADNVNTQYFNGNSGWQYMVVKLEDVIGEKDSDMDALTRIARTGLYLPTLTNGQSLDLAYVAYFTTADEETNGKATAFGQAAVNYMNADPIVTTDKTGETYSYTASRKWYGGGNKSFGMLYSSGGGQYLVGGNSGGESTSTNQYNYGYEFDTWPIGYRSNAQASNSFNAARYQLVWNSTTGKYDKVKFTAAYTPAGTSTGHDNVEFQFDAEGTTNNIYFIAATEEDTTWGSNDGNSDNGKDFETDNVKFDGYQLLERITSGVMTAGLLEGSLQTVTVNGVKYRVPVYRQETVEYIAYNLLYGLRVPMKDSSGNYNTRFIKGTESTKFGGVDLNGDGVIGWINYDGDSRTSQPGTTNGKETNEASVDLATALRHELGMTSRLGNSVYVLGTSAGVDATHDTFLQKMGNYEETLAKKQMLFGEFEDCRNAIDTAMDAAYYLLNNIFISESYNQYQDDYDYLTLSSATVNALGHSGFAYVFDAGFTTGLTATYGTTFTDDGTNASATKFDPYTDDGTGTGIISMDGVTGKTRFDYGQRSISWTTRFPFLPVTDAEGDFAGQTESYYFLDDAQRVYTEGSNSYKDRNFNYVIASNGEFVYREADNLFFEFEGDDDVYLFINGELVLDIGAAHSITSVYIDVNDYVNAAATALKGLEQYGYHKDMSIDQFDSWISAANIEYLDADLQPTGQTVANTFTDAQKAEYKRQHRLNLSDGQICQFDFYYMERHGWGANMRIVTNMHITDPALSIDKTAYQFGEEIEYGGVIDPTSAVEYNFKLTNTGNTKLYNMNWKDEVLGITMDPENGLVVDENMNGVYVTNSAGGYLTAENIYVRVTGTDEYGNETDFIVNFEPENDDGGQAQLKRFLATLESNDGTQSGYDDAEVTNAGSGLWVGGSVTFMGIYYMLTPEQTEARMVDNTVHLTATTRIDPTATGCRTLRSDASHRLYTNGFPIHYQWAGHNIFMNMEHLLEQAKIEATKAGSQLSLYQSFFQNVTLDNLYTQPCDQFGRVGGDYSSFLNAHTDESGHTGYLINYKNPGIYTFYLLMYMKSGKNKDDVTTNFASSGVNASDIGDGYYAILRSQVFVADVEDSVYVLDYGLSTESLDADGGLFKDDYLFGPYGTIRAKLMGITGDEPSFIDPALNKDATKTGINFAASTDNRIYTSDGFFNANLAIGENGKEIAYDANTGEYTLTGVGTMKITTVVPTDMVKDDGTDLWATPYLYYWYDDGTTGPTWPGTPLKKLGAGRYEVDIPADVPNVIINNGSAAMKTSDLRITPGLDSIITVLVSDTNVVTTEIDTILENVTMHVKVPSDWENMFLHYWYPNNAGESTEFPGVQITSEADSDGYYAIEIPGNVTNLLINNGSGKQTGDLHVYAGMEAWIDVSDTVTSTVENEDGTSTAYYDGSVKYTLTADSVVHATVPVSWKDTVYLYWWRDDGSQNAPWPGVAMTKGDLWYTSAEPVPADISHIVINDGNDGDNHQTVNLSVTPGLEAWIMVQNDVVSQGDNKGKYTAEIAYGSDTNSAGLTFTPTEFMDQENDMWMAITIHSTSGTPSALNEYIDIHNEVQMYKKITVLPATVVYYEDTFGAVTYSESEANSFVHHGNGSGQLSQSVDQDQPYGQDATYQGGENDLYSGDSMTEIVIMDESVVSTFEFKGTGFEIIGRTNAADSASYMARVYKKADYTTTAYDEYMVEANAYLDKVTKNMNVVDAYAEALDAYNAAIEARDAATAAPDDAKLKEAYEKALSNFNSKKSSYVSALQAHTPNDSGYNVSGDVTNGVALIAPAVLVDMTDPVLPESPFVTISWVYTQFDHGNNGGAEGINQVPTTRVTDLELGEYVVEIAGLPLMTFDPNNNYEPTGVQPTSLYLDGYRIYQPMGSSNEHYSEKEDDAVIEELRDLIANGSVAVGVLDNSGLSVSTGTTTWTESMNDNDFDSANKETYHSIKVGSTADYLIQGPNNEVYMEGNATNSALIFYVKEEADADAHELQIAVRALDYARYYGAGSSALNVQLQYGILTEEGYAWKNLVHVVSATEQYYSIPYSECPVDTQGRYQIVLRAINPNTNANAMICYTNVKLNGLTVETVDGVGEGSVIHYENGILIKPQYEMVVINSSFKEVYTVPFKGNELTVTLEEEWLYMYIRSTLDGETYNFNATSDPGQVTSATLWRYDDQWPEGTSRYSFDINGTVGQDVTFTIKQTSLRRIDISYCKHTYGEGVLTNESTCSEEGTFTYTCSACGYLKNEALPIDEDAHKYSGGVCVYCGGQETKYYLVGYINGKNYGCEGDYTNMGEYLFVDGKLEVRFDKDSYVYVKKDGNAAWYMTAAYVTTDTAILGDTAKGGYTEKMYVPCGVDLVFTLTQNDDGTMTLHYEEPCQHDWGTGVVSPEATCTTDGVRTYTCSKCFTTKIEQVPATGHSYDENTGICVNGTCGDVKMRTIYFQNTAGWEKVYIWAWDEEANANYTGGIWPGVEMTLVEGETDIYSYEVPATCPNVIFSDGGENQTDDLGLLGNGGDMYVLADNKWMNFSGEIDYYLVGSINGMDYGYGENANNMGSYKFVDGKLTVSFTKESYVLVKTTGNSNWYMADTYCDTYAATLYDTAVYTDAAEKMFVPSGAVIEFTLTINDDNTVDLVAHSWGSVQTKDPNCTEEGERTYTCYLCNDSYTEPVAALGHTFVDDVCTVCGAVDTVIVYFKNTSGWESVWAYVFTEGTPATEYHGAWPGAQMSLVEGETDLYYIEISAQARSIIFNNGGNGAQTANLTIPNDEKVKYTFGADVWTTLEEEVEVVVNKLYLDPGDWDVDSAWFAAYFFGNGDTWVKMTDANGDGIYECVMPDGYTSVIFCRMNKDMTDLSWDAKWNQTVDLTIPTDGSNFFTITNAWNGTDGKAEGTWSTYTCDHNYTEEITTAATCTTAGEKTVTCSNCGTSYTEEIAATGHDYAEDVTTEATCTTAGEKTLTCSNCSDSYTEEVAATGHSYVDGICENCGDAEATEPAQADKVYLQPGSSWMDADAWFAAWFTGAETWGTMTDNYGNGYYECEIPTGATGVVFVRMNPTATAPSWNDGEKWNQSVDLTLEANRLFVIEDPWNSDYESKATGSWTDYNATVAECSHSYTESVTTAATCTTAGEKTLTCSKCSYSYTEAISATGHNYVDGVCANSGCGQAQPTEPVTLYLQPNSNWLQDSPRFAAYFYGNGETWIDMTDSDGDGIYEVEAPVGYTSVIFCRMNPETTENNWTNKWNQTGDLTVPADDNVLCIITESTDNWSDSTWSTMTTTASFSLRITRSIPVAMSGATTDAVVNGDEDNALNLQSINDQMSSDVVFGEADQFVPGDVEIESEDIVINSASLVLSDDISMNYYVTIPENAENVYMTFQMNGQTTLVTDYTVAANGRYCFTYGDINAQKMGDNISATVYATVNGNQITDTVATYSVRAFCTSQLKKNASDAEIVSLISDLLVYGEKTQTYLGYKADELVTSGLELTPSTFTALDASFDKLTITGTAHEAVRYSGVSLVLSNKVVVRLTVETADPAAFTYNVNVAGVDTVFTAEDLVDAGDGKYYLYFDQLKATAFDETLTATILSDGQIVSQTVTYSVNSFIQRNQNADDAAYRELLQAIYNYGCSAKALVS